MKIIMYHYVRNSSNKLPYFRYLSLENFKKQLDFLEDKFGFVNFKDFIELKNNMDYINKLKNKVLLTFDDGLKDHFNFVFPELLKRNALGIFFMPTKVLHKEKALDVHRIHYLLGKMGGGINKYALNLLDNDILNLKYHYLFEDYYNELDDDEQIKQFKLIFNYCIKDKYKEKILDELVNKFCSDDEIYTNFYLNEKELKIMYESEMIIGSHSENHINFLNLNKEEEVKEIESSFQKLKDFIGPIKTFCYPYGEFSLYSKDILLKNQVDFAFVSLTEYKKDIDIEDLLKNTYTLARYDCNEFKYGKANLG
ncbi:polysaccharide deacetylase family protein [Campylobacter insulaenigrae]|uniref:polysaccharide deacetylase family protein n=1 Tax=Campylobacter insulaenigrae TaxID=260714 RepID=UPI00242B18D1|nr:polysaccharide deacetylase family protein [Campylobacter insulaenigrae]